MGWKYKWTTPLQCCAKIKPEYEDFVVRTHLTQLSLHSLWEGHCEHLTMKTAREGLVYLLLTLKNAWCLLIFQQLNTLSYISHCFFSKVKKGYNCSESWWFFTACFQQYSIILNQFILTVAVSLENAFWDCWIAIYLADELECSLHLSLLPHWGISVVGKPVGKSAFYS